MPLVTWWVVVSLAMLMVTVLQVIRSGRCCWRSMVSVLRGVLQVKRQVNGGAPGDGVVSAVDGEGVVGDASGGGAASEELVERRGR